MNLNTPIQQLSRVGPIYQKKLKKLGIKTVRDLLFHFPHRYEDFSNVLQISKVKAGQNCSIQGKILEIENIKTWKKKMFITQALVGDETSAIKAVWFNQPYLVNVLKKKDHVCLAGKALADERGLYLSNPAFEKIFENSNIRISNLTHVGRLIPVYPETERLSSRWLRSILKPLLLEFRDKIPETLPEKIIEENKLLPLKEAIWQIHFPDSLVLAERSRERFSFEELFGISLWSLRERMRLTGEKAFSVTFNVELVQRFVKTLPFKLTDAQRKSAFQILKDLEKPRPMNRLLEGDVGSGKTVVATIAALNVVKNGYQVAFMAPTEILAKQHFKTVWELIKNFNINVGLLTGKTDRYYSKKLKNQGIEISRRKLLEKTLKGDIDVLIGTHALIQDKVKFGRLALVILDEQHRFGVEQRAKLVQTSNKCGTLSSHGKLMCHNIIPHLLSMTATPIPRTLALTLYGDLDLSLIDELPKGRKKIITKIIAPADRKKTYDFIKKEVKKGRQAFVICPRIENEGKLEVKAVKAEYEKLSKEIFPDLKVGMLHGKLAGQEKEKAMRDFQNKKINILVSTSVVEVGVDIPNATIMVIEGAERFGLAQLYQFRGRVGRSRYQSYCFLFTDSPAKKTSQRLKALVKAENGFKLAEIDLQIRGPGDFSGIRQWGIPDLIMNSLKDIRLVEKTRRAAKEILEENPRLNLYPHLRQKLDQFPARIHLE